MCNQRKRVGCFLLLCKDDACKAARRGRSGVSKGQKSEGVLLLKPFQKQCQALFSARVESFDANALEDVLAVRAG